MDTNKAELLDEDDKRDIVVNDNNGSPRKTNISKNSFLSLLLDDEPNQDEEEDDILDSGIGVNRSICSRLFSPIKPGSVRGSVFSMIIIALGTGCLTIPYSFKVMSVVIAIFVLCFAGINVLMNLYFLAIVANKFKIFEYSALLKKVFDSRFLSRFYDISTIFFLIGALIAFQVIIYRMVCTVIYDFFYDGKDNLIDFLDHGYMTENKYKWTINFGIAVMLIFPLSLQKNLSKFRIISLLGVFAIAYLLLVILIECPFYVVDNHKKRADIDYNIFSFHNGFVKGLPFFPAFSGILFAFGTPVGALPIFKELHHNIERRIKKVYRHSVFALLFIYVMIGLTGYFTEPIDTPKLIVDRRNYFSSDWVFTIGKILFAFSVLFSYINNYFCARISIVNIIYKDEEEFEERHNYYITGIFIALTTTIACLYSQATDYMSIIGGLLATIISNFFPTIMWIKTNELPKYSWQNIVVVSLTSITLLLGWTSGIITAIRVINIKALE